MLGTRKIKRKIRSVNNIKKITRAMEMVSAAKLRKVQERFVTLRPFSVKLQAILKNLYSSLPAEMITHPLLVPKTAREGKRNILLVTVASNKGLCGGYNTNILKTASRFIHEQNNIAIKIVAIGKKVADYFHKAGQEVISSHPHLSADLSFQTAHDILAPHIRNYELGNLDGIWLIYAEFINPMVYKPRVKRLVPVSDNGQTTPFNPPLLRGEKEDVSSPALPYGYLFEPEPKFILDLIIPRYLDVNFYSILLSALASEHSARMMAMRNATNNADEVINRLTLSFNKARQASITKELLDIVGGAEAMR